MRLRFSLQRKIVRKQWRTRDVSRLVSRKSDRSRANFIPLRILAVRIDVTVDISILIICETEMIERARCATTWEFSNTRGPLEFRDSGESRGYKVATAFNVDIQIIRAAFGPSLNLRDGY